MHADSGSSVVLESLPVYEAAGLVDPLVGLVVPYSRCGPLFELVEGSARTVVIAGPEANAFVDRTPQLWSYSSAFEIFKRCGREPITLDGQEHSIKRRRLKSAFRPRLLRERVGAMRTALHGLLTSVEGEVVDLRELLNRAMFCETAAALEVDAPDELFESVLAAETLSLEGIYHDVGADLDEAIRRIRTLLGPQVEAMWGAESGAGMIGAIRSAWDPAAEPALRLPEIADDVSLLFRAGVENAAHVVLWALLFLAHDASWRRTLKRELRVGGIDGPLLESTVLEAERLRPPVPALPRVPTERFEFAGAAIEAGSNLVHQMTLVHFLDEVYEAPLEWRPERHLRGGPPLKTFGGGPHQCLGMTLARMQAALTLAEIAGDWQIELEREPSLGYVMKDTLTPAEDSLPVRLTREEGRR